MSDAVITAHVKENGQGSFGVTIDVSGHELHGDEPAAHGGNGSGPSPYDMLLAALGSCTAMTVRWYAKRQNWPLESVEVNLTHRKEAAEGQTKKTDIFEKQVILRGKALTEDQCDKLYEVAAKCPVQRTLEGNPVISTTRGC